MPNDYISEITNNLEGIRNAIKSACAQSNRDSNDICLIAVSKGQSFDKIRIAYDLGIRHFGENYAQELKSKIEQAKNAGLKDIQWHYIGALQTNKIKTIADAHYVHTIDSLKHAQALSKAALHDIQVFIQVKLSEEEPRAGLMPHEAKELLPKVAELPHLVVCGFMTILPLVPKKPQEFWFERMQHLAEQTGIRLSMGMSEDFVTAVQYGATHVRIGTKLFGKRGML